MARPLLACACVLLLAGLASAQITTQLDRTPPVVAVTDPAPCGHLLTSPTAVRGMAFDLESGISEIKLALVRDPRGPSAHGWQTWDGVVWVPISDLDDRVRLAVNADTQDYWFVSVDRMPSVEHGTLSYGEHVHVFVEVTNGHGLEAHWISCFQVSRLLTPTTPSDE